MQMFPSSQIILMQVSLCRNKCQPFPLLDISSWMLLNAFFKAWGTTYKWWEKMDAQKSMPFPTQKIVFIKEEKDLKEQSVEKDTLWWFIIITVWRLLFQCTFVILDHNVYCWTVKYPTSVTYVLSLNKIWGITAKMCVHQPIFQQNQV